MTTAPVLKIDRVLCHPLHLLCVVTVLVCPSIRLIADEVRPNIVFIMADDLGYGDLGCYGQTQIMTPRIDQMAAEGLRFTDYYAGSTVCAPSRCVLMTGLHTGHCYLRGNSKQHLRPGDVTVAEMLQRARYATGLFGKWGLGGENTAGMPTVQGFDQFFGYLDQTHAHNYYPTFLIRGRERVSLNNVVPEEGRYGQGVASVKNEYAHDLIVAEAIQFILDHQSEPFFLFLSVTIPHANNEAGGQGMEVPDHGIYANRDWPEPQRGLAAMITRLDSDVGQVLDLLQALGLDDRTIVFFTSDNGPHREGGNDPQFFRSSGPFRGIKRDLYEGGIRVPMIVRWPGHIIPATTTDHVAYHGDLFATALDLAGGRMLPGLDSLSYLPTLLGQTPEQQAHECLYWEFHERTPCQALRQQEWKAIHFLGDQPRVELYNLVSDPGEQHDLAAQQPEILSGMLERMRRERIPAFNWPSPLDEFTEPGQ